jgi:hypothetical protein
VARGARAKLAPRLSEHGFSVVRPGQLRHDATGVRIDLLIEGEPMPRPGAPVYPSPVSLAASTQDAHVVALGPLIELKLHARRLQDLADVGALLKQLDEARYTEIESALPAALRPQLWQLRQEALEELAMDGDG